jgi:hypothetical protein
MAKNHKPSRRGADRGPAMTKSGTGRSCASSPCSARSTVPRSKAERNPLKAAGKLHKGLVGQTLFFIPRSSLVGFFYLSDQLFMTTPC